MNNVTVIGNSGIANGGKLLLESPSHITGYLDLGTGATTGGGGYPGNVAGAITTKNMSAVTNQFFAASSTLAGLAANTTVNSNITSGQTFGAINGIADVFVVDVNANIALGSGDNISFIGDAGDYFVLNVTGDVDMNGNAAIASLAQASHVFINLLNNGDLGNVAHIGNVINGTTLIPFATYAEFHSVNGAIWGGAGEVKLMSGATVTGVPFVSSPEPSTILLLGVGLFSAWTGKKLRSRSKSE
jgi:choice-of-anchor A domain-containing protein